MKRNLKFIISNLLQQLSTKIGGEPWTIDRMPFTHQPTMICGLDVIPNSHTTGKFIQGFTASFNQTFSKYISLCDEIESRDKIKLQNCISEALINVSIYNIIEL